MLTEIRKIYIRGIFIELQLFPGNKQQQNLLGFKKLDIYMNNSHIRSSSNSLFNFRVMIIYHLVVLLQDELKYSKTR